MANTTPMPQPPPIEAKEAALGHLYTLERAGDLLGGISPTTLRLWLHRGKLTGFRLGRKWVIPRSSLERFIREASERGRR